MPSEPALPIRVTFTPEFKRNLRKLAKKYRHIKADLQPVLDQLASGIKLGDQVQHVRFEVYKVRAKNSDAQKGKSGGYRLIYFVKTTLECVLVTVYSKTEQADISADDIRQVILDLEKASALEASAEQQIDGTSPAQPPSDTPS